jgi:hypothetical protein
LKRRFVITLSIGSTIREEIVEFEDKPNVILGAVLEDARLKIQNECGRRVIMESAREVRGGKERVY